MMDLRRAPARFRRPRITTTAEDKIIKATENMAHIKSDAEVMALKKVFGTYELLENIILKLSPPSIPAMSIVNKACRDILSSNKAYKRLMSSSYFLSKSRANALTTFLDFGTLAILRLEDKDIIVVHHDRNKVVPEDAKLPWSASEPVLFTSDEDIPGLTDIDRELLSWSLIGALKHARGGLLSYEFRKRLDDGILQLVRKEISAR